jgi:hypothetical protein
MALLEMNNSDVIDHLGSTGGITGCLIGQNGRFKTGKRVPVGSVFEIGQPHLF